MEVVNRIDQVTFGCTRRCSHLETCLLDFLTGQAEARYLYLGFVQLYLLHNLPMQPITTAEVTNNNAATEVCIVFYTFSSIAISTKTYRLFPTVEIFQFR